MPKKQATCYGMTEAAKKPKVIRAALSVAALTLLLLSAPAVHAQVKQWTDEKGVTHFGNDPQADRRQGNEQKIVLKTKARGVVESSINKGIFLKVEKPGEIPLVTIGQTFYTLAPEDRATVLDAVWFQYYADLPQITGATPIIVEVFDARGQRILTHSVTRRYFK